eukprot:357701-Chlamydomonas_euryale.AAC.1
MQACRQLHKSPCVAAKRRHNQMSRRASRSRSRLKLERGRPDGVACQAKSLFRPVSGSKEGRMSKPAYGVGRAAANFKAMQDCPSL